MKSLIILLLIGTTLCALSKGNISTFHTLKTLHYQVVNELDKIEDSWKIVNTKDWGVATADTTSWGMTSSIKLNNIKIEAASFNPKALVDSKVQMNAEVFTITSSGSQAFTLEFTYDYDYTYPFSSGPGTGKIAITTQDTIFRKYLQFKEGKYKAGKEWADINALFNHVTYTKLAGKYANDAHVTALAQNAFFHLITKNVEELGINKLFEDEINKYYALPNRFIIPLKFPNVDLAIDYETIFEPKLLSDNKGVIFFHAGSVELMDSPESNNKRRLQNVKPQTYRDFMAKYSKKWRATDTEKSKYDKLQTKDGKDTWDDFSLTDGPFQIFVAQELITDLFNAVSPKMTFTYENPSSSVGLKLNVNTLSRFYPGK